ncbi:chemotaxis protein CheW [Vibrio alfacsensis]|uniref:chemotaxis protein CheW n=1 Tax=Vibrio alfacsensis TaxID=1074311 RepID=UPI00406771F5
MSSHDILSSEQALDDYFSALLGDEPGASELEDEFDLLAKEVLSTEPEPKLQLQYAEPESYQYSEMHSPELEAPNLEDVQRLLSQLESTNVVAELDIDDILEQNTIDIATEAKVVVPEVEVKTALEPVEEIQEWVIDEEPMPTVEVEQPEPVWEQPEIEMFEPNVDVEVEIEQHTETETELETEAGAQLPNTWKSTQRSADFQVLYFDVNGVTFAVPLDELGGIHNITELNHLIGRPAWYLGLQTSREQQFDVVDTAKWVMADKLRNDEYKDKYQYVVMLGDSMWGLASNQLMGTETLNADKVRWREQAAKRPWLAGMVKEKMCALIHVQALIGMLNDGLDVKSMN